MSCVIGGEALACDDNGIGSFDLIRHHRAKDRVFLYAFDLIELNGDDLRRDPLEVRKTTLASMLATTNPGIQFNEHIEGDGADHLRPMPARWGSKAGRSARARPIAPSPDWLKMKNPKAAAVKRESGRRLGTSYLSTTDTVTLTSDTPAILTILPETWTVNSS
jgi:bifunctional non-homologous end joining protein LigD